MKKLKKLVITRSKWFRGKMDGRSSLLIDPEDSYSITENVGKMCCLGFYGRQICGLNLKDLRGQGTPEDVKKWPSDDPLVIKPTSQQGYPYTLDSTICHEMVKTNDNKKITEKQREARLTKLFKKIGVNVTFKA